MKGLTELPAINMLIVFDFRDSGLWELLFPSNDPKTLFPEGFALGAVCHCASGAPVAVGVTARLRMDEWAMTGRRWNDRDDTVDDAFRFGSLVAENWAEEMVNCGPSMGGYISRVEIWILSSTVTSYRQQWCIIVWNKSAWYLDIMWINERCVCYLTL